MIFGNNNILNMIGIENPYDMSGSNSYNNFFSGYGNYSIFGCYGNPDFDAMAGAQVGNSLLGIAFTAFGSLINASAQNTKSALTEKANTLKADFESMTAKYKEHKNKADKYTKDANQYLTIAEGQSEIIKSLSNTIDADFKIVGEYNTKLTAASSPDEKEKLTKEYNEALNRINDYKLAQERFEAAMEKAKESQEKAEAEKLEMETCYAEMESISDEYTQIQQELDAKNFNKVDGNVFTRVSDKKYNESVKYDETTGELAVSDTVDIEFANKAVRRYAIAHKAGDAEGMKKAKAEFMEIYNKLDTEDKNKAAEAYKLLNK